MSLATTTLSFLSIKPHLWFDDGVHRSRSHLAVIAFTMGAYIKRVEINPDRRQVVVTRRYFWLFLSRSSYGFDDVERIDYDCESHMTSLNYDWEAADELDRFSVSLQLKTREKVFLWSFYGEGAANTGWGGVLLGGDSAMDFSGDQADASLGYAKLLCAMLGKTLT